MKMVVIFKFKVFDEDIKEEAIELAREFPGVTSVVEVEGEGLLEMRGEFSSFEMTKELKMIDESVEIFKIGPDEGPEPEVKLQQQEDDAGSSNWTTLQPYKLWEQAKGAAAGAAEQAKGIAAGAAEQAKGIATGAAEQAKNIGAGAVGLLPSYEKVYNQNKNKEREKVVKPQPKQGGGCDPRKRFGGVNPNDHPQEGGGIVAGVYGFFEKRKKQQEALRRKEWLKEEEIKQKKIWQEKVRLWQEKMKKQGGGKTQGSMATSGNTGSWWNTMRTTLVTGEASGSTQTQRTGQTSGSTQTQRTGQTSGVSTQDQRSTKTRKNESKPVAKQGKKNGQ